MPARNVPSRGRAASQRCPWRSNAQLAQFIHWLWLRSRRPLCYVGHAPPIEPRGPHRQDLQITPPNRSKHVFCEALEPVDQPGRAREDLQRTALSLTNPLTLLPLAEGDRVKG